MYNLLIEKVKEEKNYLSCFKKISIQLKIKQSPNLKK